MVLARISKLRVRAILEVLENLEKCLMGMIKAKQCNSRDGFELVKWYFCFVLFVLAAVMEGW